MKVFNKKCQIRHTITIVDDQISIPINSHYLPPYSLSMFFNKLIYFIRSAENFTQIASASWTPAQ